MQKAASPDDNFRLIQVQEFEKIAKSVLGFTIAADKIDLLFNTSGRMY